MPFITILTLTIGCIVGLFLMILYLKSIISIFFNLAAALISGKFIHVARLVLSTLSFYLSALVICGYLGRESELDIFSMSKLPFCGLCTILFCLKILSSIIINLPNICDNVLYNIVETLKKSGKNFKTYVMCLLWSLIIHSNSIYLHLQNIISGNADYFRNNLLFLCCGTLAIIGIDYTCVRLFNTLTDAKDKTVITSPKNELVSTHDDRKSEEFPTDIENTKTERYVILNGEKIRIQ